MQINVVTTACDHDSRIDTDLLLNTLQNFLACVQAREKCEQYAMSSHNAVWLVTQRL